MAVSPRDAPTPRDARPAEGSGGLDVSTLVITAIASAGAALVSTELLGSGTLVSAALTPVVIALLKEALDRPRRVVSEVVPAAVARPRRRRAGGRAGTQADPPAAPEPAQGDVGEIHIYRSTRRRWRLAILTGLLGFVIAAAVLTATELAAGGAVSGGSRATTYFGGDDGGATRSPSERRDDAGREGDPASPAPSTAPDPAATTPEDPADVPEDEQDGAPPTAPDPAAPAPPPGSTPAPAPETPAPAPAPAPEAAPSGSPAPAP